MTRPARTEHILFLTSANLACNPRCLKEVRLAVASGYRVSVVAFYMRNWADEKEKDIVKELADVDIHYLEATKKAFPSWLLATVIEVTGRAVWKLFRGGIFWPAMAFNKRSWLLHRWVKKWKTNPQLVIAHNPPAFYAAYRLARQYKIPFALDIEDYHPGENDDEQAAIIVTSLMSKLLPLTAYTSFASPLIRDYCKKFLAPGMVSPVVINNVFPSQAFPAPSTPSGGKMRIVWFSQNIGAGRGLEEMIPCMEEFADRIEVTLIGDPRHPFCEDLTSARPFISILRPLSQDQLYKTIGTFDIGVAPEPGKDLNNGLALSNKIWTYFQGGLFILASDTPAQSAFISEHPGHGICVVLDRTVVARALGDLIDRLSEIRSAKDARYERAKQFGWEKESLGLLNIWREVLQTA
jgi:glycosyltransferase involved in cell wall biosynthesis